jgi:hypothetical protein
MKTTNPNRIDDGIQKLVQQALPPIEPDAEPARDLWPAVLRRMNARPSALPWFDLALMAGLVVLLAASPESIPVLLYYL